jgi:hypothetical protein
MGECEGLGYPIIDLGACAAHNDGCRGGESKVKFLVGPVLTADSRPQMPMC